MNGKWRITLIREPDPFPFDHQFHVRPPTNCECAWICRTHAAALRIVDLFSWLQQHPEIDGPLDNAGFQRHLDHVGAERVS